MSIRQIDCDLLERAIEDGLVEPRGPNADDPDPDPEAQQFTAGNPGSHRPLAMSRRT
jgi:hypothetical protein